VLKTNQGGLQRLLTNLTGRSFVAKSKINLHCRD
jgi:hypothetical protein